MITNAGLLTESTNWLKLTLSPLTKTENAMVFGKMDAVPMEFDASSDMQK